MSAGAGCEKCRGVAKGQLFKDGDGKEYCSGCWEEYYKRSPLEDVTVTVKVRREDPSTGVGVKLAGLEVLSVETGSPASVAGLFPKMVLTHVNRKPLSSPADVRKCSEGLTEFSVQGVVRGHQRRSGKVREWKGTFGFIEPDLPIFLPPGAMGAAERSVFVGDCWVFLWGTYGADLQEGQEVEFRVEVDKGGPKGARLVATAVTGPKGTKLGAVNGTGERKERLLSAVDDMVRAEGGKPWKSLVCMYHAAGVCDGKCKKVHLKGLSPQESSTGKGAKEETVQNVRFYNVNNLGQGAMLEFRAGSAKGTMVYTRDGEERPPFRRIEYDGGLGIAMPCIKKRATVPSYEASTVLPMLRQLAEQAGVRHNFPVMRRQAPATVRPVRELMVQVSPAKLKLLQEKWIQSCGRQLVRAWELRNEALELRFRATQYNMAVLYGKKPDMVEGFHGTSEGNILSIATNGFDPLRRCGQAYGEGEYFAKDPRVSVGYCQGGSFMFMCQLILGEGDKDHTWVNTMKYYILKQREGMVQALPQYLVQFQETSSPLAKDLVQKTVKAEDDQAAFRAMQAMQKGGEKPCRDRTEGVLELTETRHVHLGWLDSKLLQGEQEGLEADVADFLRGHRVRRVVEDRNGTRVGAFVELEEAITQEQFGELNTRLYHGKYRISVDDESPRSVCESRKVCPKLTGPGKFCRGWNLAGHGGAWWESCKFQHPEELFTTHMAKYKLEAVLSETAKWDEVVGRLCQEMPGVKVVGMERIVNSALERQYESRVAFLRKKHGGVEEKELWHGTNCQALDTILRTGLVSPADRQAADKCPVSGGKGLCTTLCGTDCKLCVKPHQWGMCHMFGLGIYLADDSAKSHRYVSAPKMVDGRPVYTLLRCRANLGNPYLIEGALREQSSMHGFSWCRNPVNAITHVSQKWDGAKGHDAFYVKGMGCGAVAGKGVVNSEYIVFHNHQVLPLYAVHYIIP